IPYTFQGYALRDVPMTLAVLTVLALVAVVAPPLVTAIRSRGAARGVTVAARRAARLGIAGAIGVAAMWFGTTHLAEYPPTGLRTVIQQLRAPGVMRP